MSGRGGFSGTSRGGRGGAGGGRGGGKPTMGNTGGGKRYSADVTKGPSAWRQEWSGFISGVKMTDQGKNVKLARHADFSGGAAGGYDFSADFDEDDYFTRRFGKPTPAEPTASKKEVTVAAVDSPQDVSADAEKALPVDAGEEIVPKKRITIESEYDEESDNGDEEDHAADDRRDDRSGGNIFSYLFSSPADRKAEREAKKKEEERKRRERMLKNQRAGLAEYAGDDRSLMERALEHAKVHGVSLEGLNRKQKRELLKRTGFVHKDTDEEEKEEEEDEEKEIKPHDLMEPKIAWYQQGPFPIDEIAEKLVIKKAAKKAKQLGLKYNSLTVHESWVASRAMKRKLALIANSAPSAVKKTFDDDGNIIYDSATSQLQQNNFWSVSETAPRMPSIIAMGGAGMIGFEGGLTAPSAAPLTPGQILLEKYQQQQLKKKEERMARHKAEEEEKARREQEEIIAKEKRQKEKAKDNNKKAVPIEVAKPSEENTEEKKRKNTLAHPSDSAIDSKTKNRQNKADVSKDLPKSQESKKEEKKKKKHPDDGKPHSSVSASDGDNTNKDQDCDDIVIDRLDGGDDTGSEGGSDFDYNDYDDDGHTDEDDDDAKSSSDDSASSGDDDADDGNEKSGTAHGATEKKKSKLSDEEKDKRRKLRREQREKRKLAKKAKNPNAKAKREPKPDSVRTLRQMIFEKYGGKRPPRDVREQLKKSKQEAQARRDARKAKNKAMMKKRVGSEKPNGPKAVTKNNKPAPKKTQPDAPSNPSEMSNRQLKKLRRVEEFIAKKKAAEATGSASA